MKEEKEIKECEGITGRCVCVCVCSQKQKKNQQCGDEVNKTPWNSVSADYSSRGELSLKDTSVSTQKRGNSHSHCFYRRLLPYLLFHTTSLFQVEATQHSSPEKRRRRRREEEESVTVNRAQWSFKTSRYEENMIISDDDIVGQFKWRFIRITICIINVIKQKQITE